MKSRIRLFALGLSIGLLLLVACGGSPAASTDTSSNTGTNAGTDLGSAPLLPTAQAAEGPTARGATGITVDAQAVCLSAEEAKLGRLVNEYRASLNLPPVPVTKSMSLVAQQHTWDSTNNGQQYPPAPPGTTCNLHSWTDKVNPALKEGTWTPTCFTGAPSWSGIENSWSKPKELAGYPDIGVENSFWSSNTATAEGALEAWKNSPGHNAVITEQNGWTRPKALGVGMLGGFANLWFGYVDDPAGEAPLCAGAAAPAATEVPPTAVPTEVPPTAVPPTEVPPTEVPPTEVPPTAVPTEVPPTAVPPTDVPTAAPTEVLPTEAPTAVPATDVPATAVPATEVPATAVPATEVPATEVPPVAVPQGAVLNVDGTISAGQSVTHTFNVAAGTTYTVLVSPSAEFDVAPAYSCTETGGSRSGTFDIGFEGEAETATFTTAGNGTCTITLEGYAGSTGSYNLVVTAQ